MRDSLNDATGAIRVTGRENVTVILTTSYYQSESHIPRGGTELFKIVFLEK